MEGKFIETVYKFLILLFCVLMMYMEGGQMFEDNLYKSGLVSNQLAQAMWAKL